jgi:succinyl-CoA synthetase beta subunit
MRVGAEVWVPRRPTRPDGGVAVKLYEYMAKELLRGVGVPVPEGRLAATPEEAAEAARALGPVAVKAQVLVGGRGKAGGIRLAATPEEATEHARAILGMEIHGHRVDQVYCEQRLDIERELYLAVTVDTSARRPLLIASAEGGIAIEEVPEKHIVRQAVELPWGLSPYQARQVAARLALPAELVPAFVDVALRLYRLFRARDAELVECNPLAVVGGRLVAADARLNVDDDALDRQPDLPRTAEGTELERRVRALGLAFVQLDGDIAVMANGAGITMATIDVLQRFGGRPMNFLDVGGGAAAGPTAEALDILCATAPKAILVNIFGGITRCDEIARAIVEVSRRGHLRAPLVVRLVGTNEELGARLLREAGIEAFGSMREAAERVVQLARGA